MHSNLREYWKSACGPGENKHAGVGKKGLIEKIDTA